MNCSIFYELLWLFVYKYFNHHYLLILEIENSKLTKANVIVLEFRCDQTYYLDAIFEQTITCYYLKKIV